jgi:flagellar basal body-associated protein FliL
MAQAKSKPKANTNSVAYAVAVALLCLALGFAFAWSRLSPALERKPTVAYASIGPLVVRLQGYAFSANLAVQTSVADAKWVDKNKRALSEVLQQALANADPDRIRKPNGLLPLQETLKDAANAAFNTEQVQNVLFTDFLIQSDKQ